VSRDIRYERTIRATPTQVFDAFTSAEGQRELYGTDAPGWIVESHCDLRVGGTWSITFGPGPDELWRHVHVFEAIDRPHRLVLTTTERRLDGSELVTSLELTFEARRDATLMTWVQRGFPTDALRDEHTIGLSNAFDQLERAVARSVP
jgi:uncharacterized protein YndB with AHSA1/START domain